MSEKINYTKSSGNVFKDIGLADPDERLAKAKLVMRINALIEQANLKQTEAAKILKINQPKVSALMNGRLNGFSIERLIHFLNLLDQDVKIVVTPKHKKSILHGGLEVSLI